MRPAATHSISVTLGERRRDTVVAGGNADGSGGLPGGATEHPDESPPTVPERPVPPPDPRPVDKRN